MIFKINGSELGEFSLNILWTPNRNLKRVGISLQGWRKGWKLGGGSSNEVVIMGSVMGLFPLHNGVYLGTAIK